MKITEAKKPFIIFALAFGLCLNVMAKDVVFDFQLNPWHLPVAHEKSNKTDAKLDETVNIEQEGVIITNQKANENYYNRIYKSSLTVYAKNSITITAPRGSKIVGVDFELEDEYTFDLNNPQDVYDIHASYEDLHYTSKATGLVLKYTSKHSNSKMRKIIVHIEPNTITGITAIHKDTTTNYAVYNLQGIKVGTLSTFSSLPKGVYIIRRKKVLRE